MGITRLRTFCIKHFNQSLLSEYRLQPELLSVPKHWPSADHLQEGLGDFGHLFSVCGGVVCEWPLIFLFFSKFGEEEDGSKKALWLTRPAVVQGEMSFLLVGGLDVSAKDIAWECLKLVEPYCQVSGACVHSLCDFQLLQKQSIYWEPRD